jgi:hypothetical protein
MFPYSNPELFTDNFHPILDYVGKSITYISTFPFQFTMILCFYLKHFKIPLLPHPFTASKFFNIISSSSIIIIPIKVFSLLYSRPVLSCFTVATRQGGRAFSLSNITSRTFIHIIYLFINLLSFNYSNSDNMLCSFH